MTEKKQSKPQKILFVCSPGGHLIQANLIAINLSIDSEIYFAASAYINSNFSGYYKIGDANIRQPLRVLKIFFQLIVVLFKVRPDVVISTGAAPGAVALFTAKLFLIKTIWIDSVANVKRASLSGRLIKPFATYWISQWEGISNSKQDIYIGKIFNIFNRRNSTTIR